MCDIYRWNLFKFVEIWCVSSVSFCLLPLSPNSNVTEKLKMFWKKYSFKREKKYSIYIWKNIYFLTYEYFREIKEFWNPIQKHQPVST